jgi:DNA repair protein RecO (recombination protein O)
MRVCAELLSYSCFVLFWHRDRYVVDKTDLKHLFMGVREDVEKLSLASYFCEIATELAPHEEDADEYLRLLLNCIAMLDQDKRPLEFLEPLFTLRLLTMGGYMPNLVACGDCGCFEAERFLFLPRSAQLLCGKCAGASPPAESYLPISKGVLAAMRHILFSDFQKLFGFTLPPAAQKQLAEVSRAYLTQQTDKRFETLDFYLNMKGQMNG